MAKGTVAKELVLINKLKFKGIRLSRAPEILLYR